MPTCPADWLTKPPTKFALLPPLLASTDHSTRCCRPRRFSLGCRTLAGCGRVSSQLACHPRSKTVCHTGELGLSLGMGLEGGSGPSGTGGGASAPNSTGGTRQPAAPPCQMPAIMTGQVPGRLSSQGQTSGKREEGRGKGILFLRGSQSGRFTRQVASTLRVAHPPTIFALLWPCRVAWLTDSGGRRPLSQPICPCRG